jgi:parvulin-like peptidyl-prolyl isomerase
LAEACGVARGARIEISTGTAAFAQLAERFSDMNPERGGDLGWLHRKDVAAWMAEAIDPLSPGEMSSVIEMPFGCNLLELVDRREFAPISFDQAAPRLRNYLFQRKTEEQYTEWLDVLREQTYIDRKGAFGG